MRARSWLWFLIVVYVVFALFAPSVAFLADGTLPPAPVDRKYFVAFFSRAPLNRYVLWLILHREGRKFVRGSGKYGQK